MKTASVQAPEVAMSMFRRTLTFAVCLVTLTPMSDAQQPWDTVHGESAAQSDAWLPTIPGKQ